MGLAAALDRALRTANVPIVGVTIGVESDRATWKARYAAGATAPQVATGDALIASFDPTDQTIALADQDADVKRAIDDERLIAAVVWTVIDQLAPPATIAKFNAARTKIIAVYKTHPWNP